MGHDKILKNNIIRSGTGAILHIGTDGENDKYYAVIAKCGHVGTGYYIPVCFGVIAKDLESAIKMAKERSRVQRDRKDCILGAMEVSQKEYYLIHYHNDRDSYLTTNFADEAYDHIERRRIISQELFEEALKGKSQYIDKRRGVKLQVPLLDEIRTADKYEDYLTFQKAFAPRLYGDKYVFPTRVNIRELLDKYYGEIAVLQGILKKRAHPLILYYQIFGEGNELGLTYSYGELKYRSLNGKIVYVPVSDGEREHIETSDFVRAKQPEMKSSLDDVEYKPTTSAIDKFNRRMQKFKEINHQKQPGEE